MVRERDHEDKALAYDLLRDALYTLIKTWRDEGVEALDMEYGAGLEWCSDRLEEVLDEYGA